MPFAPRTVILYPAGGGAPMGVCRRRHACYLVNHHKAEWVFDRGEMDTICYLAIRLLPCGNPRKDFPSRRLTLKEVVQAMSGDEEISGPIAVGPYEGVAGGGSALGLNDLLRELGPRHLLSRQELMQHWKHIGVCKKC